MVLQVQLEDTALVIVKCLSFSSLSGCLSPGQWATFTSSWDVNGCQQDCGSYFTGLPTHRGSAFPAPGLSQPKPVLIFSQFCRSTENMELGRTELRTPCHGNTGFWFRCPHSLRSCSRGLSIPPHQPQRKKERWWPHLHKSHYLVYTWQCQMWVSHH